MSGPSRSRLFAMLILLTLSIAACGEDSGYAAFVVDLDGTAAPRSGGDMDGPKAISAHVGFPVALMPDELFGEPLRDVQAIGKPSGSHVRFFYGPNEDINDSVALVTQRPPEPTRPDPEDRYADVLGSRVTINVVPDRGVTGYRWDACGRRYQMSAHAASEAEALAGIETLITACGLESPAE